MKQDRLYQGVLCGVITGILFFYFKYASQPLLDLHSFRQTQTAITAYYIDFHNIGKSLFCYETPIFGYPWSIPFEFPLFQWLVAGTHQATGISLDCSGRLWSSFLYLLCFIPLYKTIKELNLSKEYFYISAILLLLSPLYFYWSRAFMIESSALLAGILFLWASICYQKKRHPRWIAGMLLFGVTCALIKITTFPSFFLAAFFALIAFDDGAFSVTNIKKYFCNAAPLLVVTAVCLFFSAWWIWHADQLKESNSIGKALTSGQLQAWNFGSLSQRLSSKFWWDVLCGRMLPHTIGSSYASLIILLGFLFADKKQKWGIVLLWTLFFIPLLLFTNLHLVHDYYQYANSIWLVLCLALALYVIKSKKQPLLFLVLFFSVASCDIYQISHHYYKHMQDVICSKSDDSNLKRLEIAATIRAKTPKNSVIITIGEGWGSEIPYYSERKAIMLSTLIDTDQTIKMLKNHQTYGGLPVSAIIFNKKEPFPGREKLLSLLLSNHQDLDTRVEIGYFDLYMSKQPSFL